MILIFYKTLFIKLNKYKIVKNNLELFILYNLRFYRTIQLAQHAIKFDFIEDQFQNKRHLSNII